MNVLLQVRSRDICTSVARSVPTSEIELGVGSRLADRKQHLAISVLTMDIDVKEHLAGYRNNMQKLPSIGIYQDRVFPTTVM
ncbi:hypothetical protein BASA62_001678 [Batrachochytrium salamandrivorans]|nr:hypothetical protein BASA62_001678 [Batrachochytrium salamandrivorans]